MTTLTSEDLKKYAETDFYSIQKIACTVKSLVQLSNLNEENWKELFSKIGDFKEERINNRIIKTKSYAEKFIELGGIEEIINIIRNWYDLKSTLLIEYDNLKFIDFSQETKNEVITIKGIIYNCPFILYHKIIGSEVHKPFPIYSGYVDGKVKNNVVRSNFGRLVLECISFRDENPFLEYILKPEFFKTIVIFNSKNLKQECPRSYLNWNYELIFKILKDLPTLKNKILNTNELDSIKEIKEYKNQLNSSSSNLNEISKENYILTPKMSNPEQFLEGVFEKFRCELNKEYEISKQNYYDSIINELDIDEYTQDYGKITEVDFSLKNQYDITNKYTSLPKCFEKSWWVCSFKCSREGKPTNGYGNWGIHLDFDIYFVNNYGDFYTYNAVSPWDGNGGYLSVNSTTELPKILKMVITQKSKYPLSNQLINYLQSLHGKIIANQSMSGTSPIELVKQFIVSIQKQAEINYKKFIKYNPLFRSGKLIEYEELMANLTKKDEQIAKITKDKTEELEQLKLEKNNEIIRIKNENDKLKQDIEANKKYIEELETEKRSLKLVITDLNIKINDLEKSIEQSSKEKIKLRETILKNQKQINNFSSGISETEQQNLQLIKKIEHLTQKIQSISEENNQLEDDNNEYEQQIDKLTIKEDNYLEKIRILMRENKQLKQEIADYAIDKEEDYPISSSSSVSSERTKQTRTIFSSKKSVDSDETQPIRLEINR